MHDATCPSFCGQEPAAGPIRDLHHVRGRRRARGSRPIPPVAPVSRGGPMPRWAIPPASSGTWPAPRYAASVPGVPPSTCLTWFHAEQACPLSGKRFLRNDFRIECADMTGRGAPSERAAGEGPAPPGVTVVVPVLDEEAALLATLDALESALAECRSAYEIVVVDDGSRDRTPGLLAFRREVAERYFDLLPDGFSFTTTTTVAAIADGLAVRFTPIDYLPRVGRSKVRPIPDTLRIGRQVLRLGIRFAPLRTAAWVAGTCALMFALSSAWHAATSGPTSADVGYLVAGGTVLALGAYGDGRGRRRP